MRPISFHNKEVIYTSPEPEIEPLPVVRIMYADGSPGLISCWKPSFWDVVRIVLGRPVYLVLLSGVHPPVLLSTDKGEVLGTEEEPAAASRNGRDG